MLTCIASRRFRFCNHLPLSSTVTLCELDLSEILPKAAFKPFLEEIQKRKRRRERAKKKKNREEAKKALEQSASSSLTEFSYMKINHSKEEKFRLETDVSADLGSSPQGISFSNVTKLGKLTLFGFHIALQAETGVYAFLIEQNFCFFSRFCSFGIKGWRVLPST